MTSKAWIMRRRRKLGGRTTAWAFGAAVTVLFGGAVLFGLNATHGMPLVPRKTVKVAFQDVGGLVQGDDVRIASSRVGYVEDIDVEQGQAVVVLKIDNPDMKVYRNASASVVARSGLGQKFVNLNPGSGGAGELADNGLIPVAATRRAQEITDLFNIFDPSTRQATGSTVREVGGGLGGHQQDLNGALSKAPQILPDVGTVSKSLAMHDGKDLTGMLQAADTLSARFNGRQQQLADLTRRLGTSLDALGADDGKQMEDSLREAPGTLHAARGALNSLNRPLEDTNNAATALRPGAEALGAATPDLRGVLREGVQPLEKVPGVDATAQPAVDSLTGVMADARPVTGQLVNTVNWASTPLAVLAPYSPEIAHFFTAGSSALSHGDAAGNWLRIYLVPRVESASGAAPVSDPTVSRDAYPAPGQAARDSASSPAQGGRR